VLQGYPQAFEHLVTGLLGIEFEFTIVGFHQLFGIAKFHLKSVFRDYLTFIVCTSPSFKKKIEGPWCHGKVGHGFFIINFGLSQF
jgi:hypothetical protein